MTYAEALELFRLSRQIATTPSTRTAWFQTDDAGLIGFKPDGTLIGKVPRRILRQARSIAGRGGIVAVLGDDEILVVDDRQLS
jgi:hypothetical protein